MGDVESRILQVTTSDVASRFVMHASTWAYLHAQGTANKREGYVAVAYEEGLHGSKLNSPTPRGVKVSQSVYHSAQEDASEKRHGRAELILCSCSEPICFVL